MIFKVLWLCFCLFLLVYDITYAETHSSIYSGLGRFNHIASELMVIVGLFFIGIGVWDCMWAKKIITAEDNYKKHMRGGDLNNGFNG